MQWLFKIISVFSEIIFTFRAVHRTVRRNINGFFIFYCIYWSWRGIMTLPKKLSISSIAEAGRGATLPASFCLVALVVVVKPLADVSANYTCCDGQ